MGNNPIQLRILPFCVIFSACSLPLSTPAETKDSNNPLNKLKISGYIAGSYNYLENSSEFANGGNDRIFDLNPDGFTLHQAAITISKLPSEGFGGLLNVIAGRDALQLIPYDLPTESQFNSKYFAIAVNLAYLQYAHKKFTFMAGELQCLAGYETINPTEQDNFSRSLTNFGLPNAHLGVRGTYAVNDNLSFNVGINNGWDNITDWQRGQTFELGAEYALNDKVSFSLAGYTGKERATPFTSTGPIGDRNLIDIFSTYEATTKLKFVLDYQYAWQSQAALPSGLIGKATWQGLAGYVNYQFNPKWKASVRGEIFEDPDGFRTGTDQTLDEATLTLGYAPRTSVEIKVETRRDFSNKAVYVSKNGKLLSYQQSYALEAMYKFT